METRNGEQGVLKPDLVLVKEPTAVVLDPTIVNENGHAIQMANRDKELKYAHLDQAIQENFQEFGPSNRR
jgi:hypothetical protein